MPPPLDFSAFSKFIAMRDRRKATMDDWRRYATRLLPAVALAGWLIAHAVSWL